MMKYLTQREYVLVRLSPANLLTLSKGKNMKIEILGQSLTNYQSTEIMNEKTNHLHYSALTRIIEDDMWIIDSGASRHMTGDQARLSNLNENKTSCKIELGDKNTYPIEEIGQTSVKLKTGNNVHLRNVLYVPGLENNLVSISCL
jgi:hypothetical protein